VRTKSFQNHMDKRLPYFWVYGCCRVTTNVSKNMNTLVINEWYINIFEIDTEHTFTNRKNPYCNLSKAIKSVIRNYFSHHCKPI